jgi:inorganic pyrophosphatase
MQERCLKSHNQAATDEIIAQVISSPMSTNKKTGTFSVVVETPSGTRNKYKFDQQSGRMKLSKVLPEGMMFPYDFGFLPGTEGEDGDPLDVLVLSDAATFPGCQVECRLIGVIKAEHTKEGKKVRNDRILAIAEVSVRYARIKEISQLDPGLLHQIDEFFVNYQKVRDIEFKIIGRDGSRVANDLIDRSRGTGQPA